MAILLAGYERYPQAKNSRPGELESKQLKKPRQNRWMRERKRFDRAHLDLIDRHIHDMTSQIMQARLDILDGTARLSFELEKHLGKEN